jgi:penicillin-binding protein 1A
MTASGNKADGTLSARRDRLGLWGFFLFLALLFITAGLGLGILLGYEYNLPPIQSLEDYRPDVITSIYSADDSVIGEFAVERRIIVSFEEIPPYLQLAIIAVEDAQFYNHSGLNYYSILRAVVKDTIRRSFPIGKGASTITLQLARMLTGRYEKTWDRKIKDILIAWKIEKRYSKHQILTLYANLHNMGPGIYGVAAAADYYFGKQPKELTLEECALIAGLPRSPGRYNPRRHPAEAMARRNLVLDRMADERMISLQLAEETKKKPIVLAPPRQNERDLAPHFVEWVRETLAGRYSTDEIWRRGMRVYTTLDIRMQTAARRALAEGLREFDKRTGWRGPIGNAFADASADAGAYEHPGWRTPLRPGDIVVGLVEEVGGATAAVRIGSYRAEIGPREIAWTGAKAPGAILGAGDLAWFRIVSLDEVTRSAALRLEQQPEVEGALVILENATGKVRALVGGYDFASSEFNRATQAMRQVGSTFKPIVYSAAFEQGLGPESPLLDTPVSFDSSDGRPWSPRNYDGVFKGEITVRQALTESRNVPTVKVASMIGIKNVVVMARRFGLAGPLDPYLPLALGACEATPLEMASAFTVFPNLGNQAQPWFLRRVEDYDRVKREEHEPQVHRVLQPHHAAAMLGVLENVVQNGTARAARGLGRPIGGKTGTTNDFTDAWFVGFTPSLTAAVWVGYDKTRNLGNRQSGSAVALPIWIDCMREILEGTPVERFPEPEVTDQMSDEVPGSAPYERKRIFVEDLP